MTQGREKTHAELRTFGFVMAVPLGILAGIAVWRGAASWPYLAGLAGIFAVLAVAAPGVLRLPERLWMAFAEKLGTVMTYVILTLAFVLVFTPVGVVMRLFGHQPLALSFRKGATSYWEPVAPDSPYTRADKPY